MHLGACFFAYLTEDTIMGLIVGVTGSMMENTYWYICEVRRS